MKEQKMRILFNIVGGCVLVGLLAACGTSGGTAGAGSRETYLVSAGFKKITVTTPKQQAQVAKLPMGKVSAVKYQGKTYYVYPTGAKDQIYAGNQAKFNSYRTAWNARMTQKSGYTGVAQPTAAQQAAMRGDDPTFQWESNGPRHVEIQQFDGFGPLDPMQGD
jgi:hypothetical protein